MRRLLSLLLLAVVLPAARSAYEPARFTDPERLARIQSLLPQLDELYRTHAAEKHIPGYVYGVVVDGRLVHAVAAGLADPASGRTVTSATRFRIASMSKSFTACAILKLRDAGKLHLDDPVARYVPEFARVQPLTTDSPVVTIRHLLRMSGGFPQDDPWGDRRLADTIPELQRLVAAGLTYSNPPGTTWEYSNLGYALLGQIVTAVAGEPYQAYITRELLQPLGMRDTVWDYTQVPPADLALGQRWEHGSWKPEPILGDGTFGAMGGLITTLEDFARYVAFHLDAWPPRDDADPGPLSRATRREMHRPADVIRVLTDSTTPGGAPHPRVAGYSYGLSWNQNADGVIWVRHAGGLPGYGSEYRFLPDHGIAVISFANLTYAPMSTVNARAMDLLLGTARLPARQLPPSVILRERAAQLATLLADWDSPAASALSPNFFQDRDQTEWVRETRDLLTKLGTVREVTPVAPLNQLRGTFSLVGEQGRLEAFFTLTPEASPRIQALELKFVPAAPSSSDPAQPRH